MTTSLAQAPAAVRLASLHQCRQQRTLAPFRLARVPLRPQRHVCKSGTEPSSSGEEQPAAPLAAAEPASASPTQKPLLAKGQGTAIVTGAISIIFGVLYLALVQFMDMRGGEMLPPPPEAYGP